MPTYAYEALNAAGKPQSGTIEASNSDEAVQRIKGEGFFPTAVREQKVKGDGSVKGTGLMAVSNTTPSAARASMLGVCAGPYP